MNSKEVLEYLKTCKFCKIVMGTDYENDDRYFTLYDVFSEEIEIIQKDLDRLEMLEEILDILRDNTYICKNGDGFTISIWLNTENCDMPSCSNLDELLKVLKVLKEKKVMRDTYSKEVLENE